MEKREIIDIHGKKQHIDCLGCARERGEIGQHAILRSRHFDAHQDYEIPIPGFIIISSKRHIKSVDEFTEDERIDFIDILCTVRKTMRQALGIGHAYLVQEEDTSHHFHMWIFPRHEWMAPFGWKIQSVRPIMEHAREHMKTGECLKLVDESAEKMKRALRELP